MEINRRKLLSGTAVTAATLGATKAFASRKRYRFRLALTIPKTLPIWGEGVERFAKNVKEMSDGKLDIRVYGASELVPAFETFDAVKSGKIQMGHAAPYYWQGKIPASVFFCTVPFGMNSNAMRAWIGHGGGQELWDELYAKHGIKPFLAGSTTLQMGGWFRKEIKSLADLKGLKMRIPGLGGRVLEKLGAKPTLIAAGEIFTALSTGVIDATEWVGPYHDYTMGFHKAAKYYYYPGWHEPGPMLELIINKKAWDELPNELQAIVKTAAAELDRNMYAEWIAKDMEYLQKIRDEKAAILMRFPNSVLNEFKRISEIVKDEISERDPDSKKIYASYKKFQESFELFQQTNEMAYSAIIQGSTAKL